jgi:hypothetical protein
MDPLSPQNADFGGAFEYLKQRMPINPKQTQSVPLKKACDSLNLRMHEDTCYQFQPFSQRTDFSLN